MLCSLSLISCSSFCYFVPTVKYIEKVHAKFFFIDFPIGYVKIVEMLIKKGANLNALNDDGNSAITVAAKRGNKSNVL